MNILTFNQLPKGGFAGLIEKQFVKDQRVFSASGRHRATNGIGNFVYLADANFLPHGETGMHGHREIDVISVMVDGQVSHAGSLEHGKSLTAGQAQVQRAGGEGFSHNEINPNSEMNQMIQLWVLPEESGSPAGYKVYDPKINQLTTIYGGNKSQSRTFASRTRIQMVNAKTDFNITIKGEQLAYLSKGKANINGQDIQPRTLVRVRDGLIFTAKSDVQLIVINEK